MSEFGWPVRVYHEDVDTMSVVYYGNYLKFYERARTEYLRASGFEQHDLMQEHGIMFVVKNVNVDYLRPARYNDLLWVTAEVSSFKRTSFHFDQKVYRQIGNNKKAECLNQATVLIVCVDTLNVRPAPIPEAISEMLQQVTNLK